MSSYADLTLESLIETAKNEFRTKFDQEPEVCSLAPGRINLIGDHTDYNDGYVLPMVSNMSEVDDYLSQTDLSCLPILN